MLQKADGVAEHSRSALVAGRRLSRAVWLLFAGFAPIAAVSALICGLIYASYLENPDRTRLYRLLSIDHHIVHEQLHRISTLPRADIALMGDSSCLMGFDLAYLRTLRPELSVESFCTTGTVGPEGYGKMLRLMVEDKLAPERLVLAFHPIQFRREPTWDIWLSVIDAGGTKGGVELGFPLAALDHMRLWLESVFYQPLPGPYAHLYGSAKALLHYLRTNHGTMIDPGTGLRFPSVNRFLQSLAAYPPTRRADYSFATNQRFEKALASLAGVIAEIGREKVFLMIMPVPAAAMSSPQSHQERREAARKIASLLGLPAGQILDTPATMPDAYFSLETHLNRWGRLLFTQGLADTFASVRSRSLAGRQ